MPLRSFWALWLRDRFGFTYGRRRRPVKSQLACRRRGIHQSRIATAANVLEQRLLLSGNFASPNYDVPPATQGTKGATTPGDVAVNLATGFNSFTTNYLDDVAATLNLANGTLPLVGSDLADALGLTAKLQAVVPTLSSAGITTLSGLQSALAGQGFTVDFSLSDAEFAALSSSAASDFIRAHQTFSLLDLAATMGARAGGLSGVQYLESLGFSGNLNLLGGVGFSVGLGVDTQGFYVIPAMIVEGQLGVSGSATAAVGGTLSATATADFELSAFSELTTANADGRIRLSDLTGNFSSLTDVSLTGQSELTTVFTTSVAGSSVSFDGTWNWDLAASGPTLDVPSSGLNSASLLRSLANLAVAGIDRLGDSAASVAGPLGNVPFVGGGISSAVTTGIAALLNVDGLTGPLETALAARGFTLNLQTTAGDFLSALIANTAVPNDLLSVSYTGTRQQAINAAAAGSQTFAGLNLNLNGSLQGTGDLSLSLAFGVDASGGIYLIEGGDLVTTLNLTGALTGTGTVTGLTSLTAAGQGQLTNVLSSLDLTDGDASNSERFYLMTSGGLTQALLTSASWNGNFSLNNLAVTASIPSLTGLTLPPFQVTVGANYNLANSQTAFTSTQAAMLDGLSQWVFGGLSRLKTDASNLTSLIEDIPLFGKNLATGIQSSLQSGFDFTGPSSGVSAYLTARGFTISKVVTAQELFSGTLGTASLIELAYSRTLNPASSNLNFSGDLQFGATAFTLGGTVNVAPTLTYSATFGMDLISGPYVLEGANVSVAVPVSGSLTGTATIGKLVKINATADANLDVQAKAVFSDFDATANERFYLIASRTSSPMYLGEILQAPQSRVLTGQMDLVLHLTVDNPAAKLPVLGKYLPGQFGWNATAGYNLATGVGTYTVQQDAALQQVVDLFSNTEQAVLNAVLDELDKNNPLPQSLRDLLTKDLPVIGMSPIEIVGLPEEAELILNPKSFQNRSSDDLESGSPDDNHVIVNFDAGELNNVIALLSGQEADLVSLDVRQSYSVDKTIPVVAAPLFSLFGVINFDVAVNVVAELGLAFDMTFGLDTTGFYIQESTSTDDYVAEISGMVGGQLVGTGRLVILPFAQLAATLGLVATGGVTLISPDDDKVRINELSDPNVVGLGVGLDLNLKVDGSLGFPDLNLSSDFPILNKDFELYRAHGSAADIGGALSGVGDKLLSEAKKLALKAALGPLVLLEDVGQAVVDAVGNAIDTVNTFVGDTTEQLQEELANLAGQAEGALTHAGEVIAGLLDDAGKALQNLGESILTGIGIDDPGSIFGKGKKHDVTPPERRTFNYQVVNGVLTITANASHGFPVSAAADLVLAMAPDGRLVVDGPDFVQNELVAYRKYDCWDGCDKEEIYDDYTHYNRHVFSLVGITRIEVIGTALADRLIVDAGVSAPVKLRGEDGDDTLIGGSGNDILEGGGGFDQLYGGAGNDSLSGGDQDDFLSGGAGIDTLRGGNGNDTLDESQDDSLSANYLYGDIGDDVLRGSIGADILYGGDGNDKLFGGLGDDFLYGQANVDYLQGDAGNDYLDGGAGTDSLVGDDAAGKLTGNDTLHGGADNDVLQGGKGDDNLYGGGGADKLLGGEGNDLLVGALWNYYESTDDLADEINGGDGNDTAYGGRGDDTISGGANNDTLYGGTGNDVIDGGAGTNVLEGQDGNDTLVGIGGDDTLRGGKGDDLLSGRRLYGGDGNDTLVGTYQNDWLYGEGGNDKLTGNGGDDLLTGGDGNDRLTGGQGADSLYGDAGNDVFGLNASENIGSDFIADASGTDLLDFNGGSLGVSIKLNSTSTQIVNSNLTLRLNSGVAFENVTGTTGNDSFTGNSLNNVFTGAEGNDSYYFNTSTALGIDQVNDSSGNDFIDFTGSNLPVVVSLATTSQQAVNANLQLKLSSGASIERLTGGSKDDSLTGNALANVITGGAGNDVLTGLAGDDIYIFDTTVALGSDTVNDSAGMDLLDFSASTAGVSINLGTTAAQVVNSKLTLTLTNSSAIENATGGSGNDTFIANKLDNILTGNAGNDTYVINASAAAGLDLINDASGIELLDFSSSTSGVKVNLGSTAIQTANANLRLQLSSDSAFENLIGGSGNDQLTGNALANTLTGNAGSDTLNGLDGDDIYKFNASTPLGADQVNDTTGIDLLDFTGSALGVNVNLGTTLSQTVNTNLTLTLAGAAIIENLTGGSGDDTLAGNSLNNIFRGLGGNDTYVFKTTSQLGSDQIIEESGVDTLDFNGSTLDLTVDLDVATAQTINANLTLSLGSRTALENAIGGSGNDRFHGNSLANSFTGGLGNDTYLLNTSVANGSDRIDDAGGRDILDFAGSTLGVLMNLASTQSQSVNSNLTLTLTSGESIDDAYGSSGNDVFGGNSLNNFLDGKGGDDAYAFNPNTPQGTDTIADAAGNDTLDYSATSLAVTINLGTTATQTINANHKLILPGIALIENAIGGSGDDSLTGNSLANTLVGNGGNDTLWGNDDNDTLNGGTGNDSLWGGAGDDSLYGGYDNDLLVGDSGGDALNGDLGNDVYQFYTTSQLDSDTLTDAGGIDLLDFSGSTLAVVMDLGSTAQQTVNANLKLTLTNGEAIENALGGSGADSLTGNTLDNDLQGLAGNDTLISRAGNDVLSGGTEDDILSGMDGNDTLIGGAGSDQMSGGWGADLYRFDVAVAAEADVIEEGASTLEQYGAGPQPVDILDFSSLPSNVGVTVDLTIGNGVFASQTGRTIRSISPSNRVEVEEVRGGAGNDRITARSSDWDAVTLNGNGGDDAFLLSWEFSGELVSVDGGTGYDQIQLLGTNVFDYAFSTVELLDVSQLSSGYFGSRDGASRTLLANNPGMMLKRESGELAPIGSGWNISRAIATPGDIDTYDFYLTAPTRLWFDTRSVSDGLRWSLTGPAGNVVSGYPFSWDDQQIGLLPPGKYTLTVTADGDLTGAYDFRLLDLDRSATPIALDAPVTITLNPQNETRLYRFDGTAGSTIYLDLTSYFATDDAAYWQSWQVLDSVGTVLLNSRLALDGERLTLPNTGTYTLLLQGTVPSTGYTNASFTVRTVQDDSAPLTINSAVSGRINTPGQEDRFTFTLTAPASLWFDSRTSNDNLRWRLSGPSDEIRSDWPFVWDDDKIGLLPAGTYTLTVDAIGDAVADYAFAVLNPANGISASLDTTYTASLNPANQTKFYKFSGTAGSTIYIDQLGATHTTENWNGYWSLQDPAGVELQSNYLWGDLGRVTLPQTGVYTLAFKGWVASTGSSQITFRIRTVQDDAAPLTLNLPNVGSVAMPGQLDRYNFTLSQPTRLRFDTNQASSTDLVWRLRGPTGEVRSWTLIDWGTNEIELLPSGAYTLEISGRDDKTGGYSVTLQDRGQPAVNNPATVTGTAITVGSTVTGSIATPGDIRSFKFTLNEPTRLWFDARTNDPNLSWVLIAPGGNQIAGQSFIYDDANLGLLAPGTYQVQVKNDSTGSFAFQVMNLASATALSLDSSVSVTLNPANQTKMYQFAGTAGGKIYIDQTSYTPAEDNPWAGYWSLLDPSGTELANNVMFEDLGRILLPQTGQYVLVFQGVISATGNTKATVVVRSVTDDTTPLTLGTGVSGNISIAGQKDYYTFSLASPTRLWFDSRTNSSELRWRLTGPAGEVSTVPNFGWDDFDLGLLAAGNYTLTVEGDADAKGIYAFNLLNLASATNISFNTAVTTTLTPANSTKLYKFTGTAGSTIYVDQTSYTPTGGDVWAANWILLDPYGKQVLSSVMYQDAGRATLAIDGTYTLVVQGMVGYTGTTKAGFRVRTVADDAAVLNLNAAVTGSIATPGQQDVYRFTLNEASRLWFDSRTYRDNLRWQLAGPTGLVIETRDFAWDDVDLKYLAAGDYTLTVFGDADATGSYAFSVLNLADAASIALDTNVSVTLTPASQAKHYKFEGKAGDTVYLDQLSYTPAGGDVWAAQWVLLDPYGSTLVSTAIYADGGRVTLPFDGTYTLLIQGSVAVTGTTKATIQVRTVADNVVALPLNSNVTGNIAKIGQNDIYRFTLTAPSRLWLDIQTANSNLYWTLIRPTGEISLSNYLSSDDADLGLLPAGEYTLTINDLNDVNVAGGAYSFALLDLAKATPISIGSSSTPNGPTISGTLNPSNSARIYSFSAVAGNRLTFDKLTLTANESAEWSLLDPTGFTVFTSTFADKANVTLKYTGTYTLKVSQPLYVGTGTPVDFSFRVNFVTQTTVTGYTGTAISVGSVVSSSIAAGATKNYLLTLSSPQRLWFDSQKNDSSVNWSLWGPNDVQVTSSYFGWDDSDLGLLPAGTYQLRVTSDASTSFAFQIFNLANATNVSLDVPLDVTLSPATQSKFYKFNGAAGSTVYLDQTAYSAAGGNTIAGQWMLFDPNGTQLTSSYLSTDGGRVTLPFTGVYTLVFQGYVQSTGTTKATVVVRSVDPTVAPVLTNLPPAVAYTVGGPPVVVGAGATIADDDSTDFDGGSLTVALTANAQSTDRLTIQNQGTASAWQISTVITDVAGNSGFVAIMVPSSNGLIRRVIGTFTGGVGTNPLVIRFNANATPDRVQRLLRSILYSTVSPNPSLLQRTLQYTLTDGDGAASAPVISNLNLS
ncbi:M10 family metallopeptidase C-terminal domain-containing protein [Planctomicrobium piriforme]|uniref:Ca2+-binding protein, RTX toxin-related n=1 Tax=Planctomicrobium piriforme TaxID=1576369 RepID=A0A1I3SJK4_9PLAN|nr:M10 family metallopeptidase C-terminal domain-containing protein [Planctomicrobium piriforme]SFJ58302.1 Ca2+-binding protein, RTX toxin-related [Planctomicrobium piriforme]